MKGIQNGKKAYLTIMNNITVWLYHSLAGLETMSLIFKEQRQIVVEKAFCDCCLTPYM